jgi:hypothetical protein
VTQSGSSVGQRGTLQAVDPFVNVVFDAASGPYPCPCCSYVTLSARGAYEIRPVCFWEDDGQDEHDADEVRGGPNYSLSLTAARRNFERIRAAEERVLPHVRPPRPEECPRP